MNIAFPIGIQSHWYDPDLCESLYVHYHGLTIHLVVTCYPLFLHIYSFYFDSIQNITIPPYECVIGCSRTHTPIISIFSKNSTIANEDYFKINEVCMSVIMAEWLWTSSDTNLQSESKSSTERYQVHTTARQSLFINPNYNPNNYSTP